MATKARLERLEQQYDKLVSRVDLLYWGLHRTNSSDREEIPEQFSEQEPVIDLKFKREQTRPSPRDRQDSPPRYDHGGTRDLNGPRAG